MQVIGLERLTGPLQRQEFYNMGREFAYEGLEKEYFKSSTPEELEAFEAGYNAALVTISEQQEKKEQQEQTGPKMGK